MKSRCAIWTGTGVAMCLICAFGSAEMPKEMDETSALAVLKKIHSTLSQDASGDWSVQLFYSFDPEAISAFHLPPPAEVIDALNCLKITSLNLDQTGLTDEYFARLRLPIVKSLVLDLNELTDKSLELVGRMPQLEELSLMYLDEVTDRGFANLKQLSELRKLSLRSRKLTADGVRNLVGLRKLHSVRCENFGAGVLSVLVQVKSIRELRLPGAMISDEELEQLQRLPLLEVLDLSRSGWDDAPTDKGLVYLKEITNLRELNLTQCKVGDAGMTELAKCRRLESLNLLHTSVTNAGVAHLKSLQLKELTLSTHVTSAALESIAGMLSLETLAIPSRNVGDGDLKHLKGLKNLRKLEVSATQVTLESLLDLQEALPELVIAPPPKLAHLLKAQHKTGSK